MNQKQNPIVLFLFLLGFAFLLLICWLFWILSGEALGFVIFALLINIFYFFGGYYFLYYDDNGCPSQRRKKMNQKQNPKFDENGEEIVWELERSVNFYYFLSYINCFLMIIFCTSALLFLLVVFCIYDYTTKETKTLVINFLLLAFFIWAFVYCTKKFYNSLNLKTMYLTKNSLFIKRYLGKNLQLALGTFYARRHSSVYQVSPDMEIKSINSNSVLYYLIEGNHTNITELQAVLKPYIVDYITNAGEKEYKWFQFAYYANQLKHQYNIDFEEIDKLRKEQENGK